ncbi:hypothetical protein [Polyangium spumosum]|uniref:Chitin-binding type-2 domain-containing protein n=1 Tax=Polyangium spumosum TaxID=889282 RepID=A0A6N7PLY7_9BACT|nr:hypothetical protein [Polyangium spumosum]MRG91846.1 hypothetical protein [Polyangium spumosum]
MAMRPPLVVPLVLGLGVASSTSAFADVIHDMPITCPTGTEKDVSHEGPYCVPPLRADCPPGYEPRVVRSTSYCEAPPPAPCSRGLHWESTAPDQASCVFNERCGGAGETCAHGTCGDMPFCIEKEDLGRFVMDVARGACKTTSDCAAFPKAECRKRLTCSDSRLERHEAARIEAAKRVPASAVPAPYVAASGGAEPPYPVLKDGQAQPALPDAPQKPGDPSPTSPAPANMTKPSSGGGCAGCAVDVSDRGGVGWAALMSLLGVGIALRRKGGRG